MKETTKGGLKTKAILVIIITFIIVLSVTLLSYTQETINYTPTKVLEFPEIEVK